jgi:hypothetical protein
VNPYESPLANQGTTPALLPLWRRIVSLPLIIFGAGYAFALPVVGLEISMNGFTRSLILPSSISAIGAVLLWSGLRMRRKKFLTSD